MTNVLFWFLTCLILCLTDGLPFDDTRFTRLVSTAGPLD